MKSIDPHKIADYIHEVAQEKIVPRFRNLEQHEIDTKTGPNDLVTIADQEAEAELEKIFKDILPGSIVVGEEGVSAGAASIDDLVNQSDPTWIIDPVDGTKNFAEGRPVFGCMAALVHKGQTLQGWIYDIPGARMGIAESSAGCEINGEKKTLEKRNPEMPFSEMKAYIARGFIPKDLRAEILPIIEKFSETVALHCCAHEYLNLVEDLHDLSFYKRMKPWDHLPGLLLYREAGGYSRSWTGKEHRPEDDWGGILNAPDEILWERLHALLLPPKLQHLIER